MASFVHLRFYKLIRQSKQNMRGAAHLDNKVRQPEIEKVCMSQQKSSKKQQNEVVQFVLATNHNSLCVDLRIKIVLFEAENSKVIKSSSDVHFFSRDIVSKFVGISTLSTQTPEHKKSNASWLSLSWVDAIVKMAST